jgi:hypothetical protein
MVGEGNQVILQKLVNGKFVTIKISKTDANGNYTFNATQPNTAGVYRVFVSGSSVDGSYSSYSDTVHLASDGSATVNVELGADTPAISAPSGSGVAGIATAAGVAAVASAAASTS